MKLIKFTQRLIVLSLCLFATQGFAVRASSGPGVNGIDSLSNSYVFFDPTANGEQYFLPGASQTFCFSAVSYTTDWEYVYYLYMRFPSGWAINTASISGTPSCLSGGTIGNTLLLWQISSNEARLSHPRYHNISDTCQAFYCFSLVSGNSSPSSSNALISWYWSGTEDGSLPLHPCSSDGYTPAGQDACDQSIWPPAVILPASRMFLPIVKR
jgi:hypothetical protein